VEEPERIVAQIRARWPKTRIIIRGDSGFCRDTFERLVAFSYKKRDFAPAVAPAGWPRQRPFSRMKYSPMYHFVSG
jgi:hypothetical protein